LLAEERLDSARRYVPAGDTSVLSLAISQALAKCYRMQGRVAEAHRELTRLHSKDGNPAVLDFYYAWTESLLAKFGGDLRMADELAKAAEEELQRILTSEDIAKHMSYADSLGFGPLPRKLFHCFRHRADIARRAGRYQESGALLAKAVEGYEADPEAGVLQYAGLVRAHLLRHEGDFGTAEQLAQEAVDFFASEGPRHRRGAMMALRCLAQAQLAGNEPTDAHAALTALLDADPKHYPAGRTFALYGLGELARYDGDTEGARRYYHDAFDGGDERQVRFERWYARLSTAELEREDHPDRTGPILRELIARPEVFSHPAVRFAALLVRVRLSRTDADLEAAGRVLDEFRRRPGDHDWEGTALRQHEAALDDGTDMPRLVFNLP
jgi:tetratricopeptide (TPR) repeat protein